MKEEKKGLSADDLALLAAVLTLIADVLALLALLMDRQEETSKK